MSVEFADYSSTRHERRKALRIKMPFPALVCGIDTAGRHFEERTVIDNMSAEGLYVRLSHLVAQGSRLFMLVHLAAAPLERGPSVALRGTVMRTETRPGSRCGYAISFTSHWFLYNSHNSRLW